MFYSFFNNLRFLGILLTPTLYYFPSGWIHSNLGTDDLRVESGHLRSAPSEQIRILAQASFDLLPRQVGESGANLHSFAWVFAEGDEFEVSVRNWLKGDLLAVGRLILFETGVQGY